MHNKRMIQWISWSFPSHLLDMEGEKDSSRYER